MSEAVRTEALRKVYPGNVEAVKAVSLSVRAGEIFGFLGPNGAGKTTLVSMLTTVLRPTSGYAEVGGLDLARSPERIRRRIGLVFQRSTADEVLTGRENLEVATGLHGISPRVAAPRISEILRRLDLSEAADRRVSSYSGGMRRRLEIAAGIVHEPEILFLDEPTLGLDPHARSDFWEYIRELRSKQSLTIFLTTHYLDEADHLSDRVSIIDHGSILTTGTPEDLKDRLGGDRVVVRPSRPSPALADVLRGVPGVLSVDLRAPDGSHRVRVSRSESMVPSIVRACDAAGIDLSAVSTRQPSLDEVFLMATGREYRENSEGTEYGTGQAPAVHASRGG